MPGNDVGRTGGRDAAGAIVRGTVTGGREVVRGTGRVVGAARQMGGAGNPGLMRLLDVHTSAVAGDVLVVIGLLTALLFTGSISDARTRVALFLVVALVPFAIVAPLIGPLLDRFRHGRRFTLAASLFLRAVLAWIISMNVDGGLGLYGAAFGMILLSRGYAAARSAALARLVTTTGLRPAQASARATVFATLAGSLAIVFGFLLALTGPQWPLRLASVIFAIGAVIAINLPPLADTEPPQTPPRPFGLPWRSRTRGPDGTRGPSILSGRSVGMAVLGAGSLRLLYGFLLVFLAFAIRTDGLGGGVLTVNGQAPQLAVVGAAFGLGTLVATVVGMARRAGRTVPLLVTGAVLVALAGPWASVRFSFLSILALCWGTAVASGLAKVGVDAAIHERVSERDRADAFARAETLLMLIFLAGGAIGLAPNVPPQLGIGLATLVTLVVLIVAIVSIKRTRASVHPGHSTPPSAVVAGELPAPAPGPA
ncbi:MAG: MFS transporter, partial [Micromonosporaceae bacterium]|nr:MFS transporter [Micromonosporaceae bacterium]